MPLFGEQFATGLSAEDKALLDQTNTNVSTIKTDVAGVKTDVGTVNTNVSNNAAKIGANTDAAGTGTLFARAKQIYDYLTAQLTSTRAAKLDLVGATTDAAGTGTIFARLKQIYDYVVVFTGKGIVYPSAAVRVSMATERTGAGSTDTLLKEFISGFDGKIRLNFEQKVTSGATAYYYVEVDNTNVGNWQETSTTYVSKTIEIRVKKGDVVGIKGRTGGTISYSAFIRNLNVCYDFAENDYVAYN